MSAFGGKADTAGWAAMSAFDPKRTYSCCSSEAGSAPIETVVCADTMQCPEPEGRS